jgi:hypothetical protein
MIIVLSLEKNEGNLLNMKAPQQEKEIHAVDTSSERFFRQG